MTEIAERHGVGCGQILEETDGQRFMYLSPSICHMLTGAEHPYPAPVAVGKRGDSPYEDFPLINRLHSDMLEDTYGPISTRVLRHDAKVRESHLIDPAGVSRTYAITLFPDEGLSEPLRGIDAEIRAGSSIGKTFRRHGYEVRKNVLEALIVELPLWLREAFADQRTHAQARLSELLCRNELSPPLLYGTAIEVYHPDFRCAETNHLERLQEAPTWASLITEGLSSEEIWQRLGSESKACSRDDERYLRARLLAEPQVFALKERMQDILESDHGDLVVRA